MTAPAREEKTTMANYVFAYKGGATPDTTTEEERAEIMAAWNAWYGELGETIVDGGAPFGPSQSVAADGSVGGGSDLTGYTIVKADSLSDATNMAKGCPIRQSGGSIDVYEAIDMPTG